MQKSITLLNILTMPKTVKLTLHFYFFVFTFFVLLISSFVNAQESKTVKTDTLKTGNIKQPNSPQAEEGDVKITDGTNTLIRITDEGTFGAIEIKNGVPSATTNKLYNDAGTLSFNGSSLSGGATQIDDLTDAKNDGSSLFFGFAAGNSDGGSNQNIGTGIRALTQNTLGKRNIAIGYEALSRNTSGSYNVAIGYNSLQQNTGSSYNTAIGYQALLYNTSSKNTAVGYQSLFDNTSGSSNTAIGYNSLTNNSSGYLNTSIGISALSSNTTGYQNTAIGSSSLYSVISGSKNTAIGASSLYSNTGSYNTAIGIQALNKNTSGSSNIGIGNDALNKNTTGNYNVAIGLRANYSNQNGSYNTIIGYKAGGGGVQSRNRSIFLGSNAGYNETTNDKLYIENSNSSSPLIWGDFANDLAAIHGKLGISTKIPTSKVDIEGSNGYDQFRMRTSYTPTSSSDANGEIGDTAWDDNYFYIKTNAGWKRTALSTF